MNRLIAHAALLAMTAMLLAGCTSAAIAVIDEKISSIVDMDCTSVGLILNGSYCRSRDSDVAAAAPVYCYRTLGRIDCYASEAEEGSGTSPRVAPKATVASPLPPAAGQDDHDGERLATTE
ncbi:hypothetical protein [Oceanibacterium hippocampi]|uniref:Lipoprotein n=1 Tax=Oceanibacterium hippocampi TaxID=745714 RepID=A0A1Y5RTZ3_9PROT|nr:hypothetical protein [Oceanibacterium hippocampi]SLN25401.1 hypothetical protein OCH7691_00739 [Oceanibacterium hippocampi]